MKAIKDENKQIKRKVLKREGERGRGTHKVVEKSGRQTRNNLSQKSFFSLFYTEMVKKLNLILCVLSVVCEVGPNGRVPHLTTVKCRQLNREEVRITARSCWMVTISPASYSSLTLFATRRQSSRSFLKATSRAQELTSPVLRILGLQ